MKRLLSFILILMILLSCFAACSSDNTDNGGSFSGESALGSDSSLEGESELFTGGNGFVDVETPEGSEGSEGAEGSEGSEDPGETEAPAKKDVKESTAGMKFVLNKDGKGYTLMGKGSATATDIFIDGHEGLPVTTVAYGAFANDKKITSVTMGESVERVENFAFSMCSAVTKITLGKNVKHIGEYSFRYCTSMTDADLGSSLEVVGRYAFYKSSKLANIKMPNTLKIIEEGIFDKTALYDDSTKWSGKALYFNKYLVAMKTKSYTDGDGVNHTIIDASGKFTVADGTLIICEKAFRDGINITEIVVPDSVKTIGEGAFSGCTKLATVTMGKGVERIGEGIFGCGNDFRETKFYNTASNWKNGILYAGTCVVATKPDTVQGKVTLAEGTTAIADAAFARCEKITSIVVPESVLCIGEYAFTGCAKLADITIGSGVKTIGKFALKECSSLNGVTFKKTSGWRADGVAVPSSEISSKSNALKALAFVYAASEWRA